MGDQGARLGPARKTLERLARKAEPVAPPLPGPVQRRQERRAGYEHAKEDIAKWQGIVKVTAQILHYLGHRHGHEHIQLKWHSIVKTALGSGCVMWNFIKAVLRGPPPWTLCLMVGRHQGLHGLKVTERA